MEELRPLAAKKLGIQNQDVKIPYDLATLMPLDELWGRIAHELKVLTFSVQYWTYTKFFIVKETTKTYLPLPVVENNDASLLLSNKIVKANCFVF